MTDYNRDGESRAVEANTIYIGEGATVNGDIVVPQIVVIDGSVEGNVTARAVWVGASGVIKGKIVATEAEIFGTVSEVIEVKQLLFVHSTGRVSGNVSYGELLLEKGAIITGTFSSTDFRADDNERRPELILGAAERPAILHRIEPVRPVNGSGGHTTLPAADFRAAG
jgi:cytoskeletal protein CcmA (bactofilin family)